MSKAKNLTYKEVVITKKMANLIYLAHTRKHVIKRDKGLCLFCEEVFTDVHHLIHRSQGIFHLINPQNCVYVCRKCHSLLHTDSNLEKEIFVKGIERMKSHYEQRFATVKEVLFFLGVLEK